MKNVLLVVVVLCYLQQQATAARFVCYFPNWAFYRTGIGKYTVDNIPKLCTNLIYAFATLDPTTYTIKEFDAWVDLDNSFYSKFNALKLTNPGLKTSIAIGGWTDSQGSNKYSLLVSDSARITTFVNSVVAFLKKYGFDGLDVDWEYPSSAADKTGFGNLLKALRSAFTQNGFVLSVAVGAGQGTIDAGYDVPTISQNVDFINLMTYDMHGPWEPKADHHAPLYKRSWETTSNNVDFSVNYWISKGASPSKLILGIPLYGKSWKLSSSVVVPPAPASGPGAAGPQTGEAGTLAYYEICYNIRYNGWKVVTDPNMQIGPYAYSLPNWVGYDDTSMAAYKARYALSKGLGGAMVWDISMDDFSNVCGGGTNPVMTAIARNLNSSSVTTTTSTFKPTTKVLTTTKVITTTKAASTTKAALTTTTKPTTKASGSTTPSSSFVCPSPSGLFRNPASCSSFYSCSFARATLMQCPSGLFFNPSLQVCDWPANVNCTSG